MIAIVASIAGFALLAIIVADAGETVIITRHARRLPRLTCLFFQMTWRPLVAAARRIKSPSLRESYLAAYGPLSLLLLLALWALGTILGFALVQWSIGARANMSGWNFVDSFYFSASTFFTLGVAQPVGWASKYLMVLEAGFGFSFLGLVIGYLPVFYQSYSSRELRILHLDARAGSPPSAAEFLRRNGSDPATLEERLAVWETWALELLESHLSYPMLAYYRSQHANQSWVAALTTILDASALIALAGEDDLKRQAEFTFAAGRHALAHVASVIQASPHHPRKDRLPEPSFADLCQTIVSTKTPLQLDGLSHAELAKLRVLYEPYANALSRYFLMPLPPWSPTAEAYENWRRSSWEQIDAPVVASHPFKR